MLRTNSSTHWIMAMAIVSGSLTFADDIDFTGVSGSHWLTPSNWENGSYPATSDTAFLDATASLDTPSPNDLHAIKVGTQGAGIMHVTFSGSLNADAVDSVSQIGSGTGNQGSVEQTNGSIAVNALEVGSNSATGTYKLNRGTLKVARRSQNNSIYLGTNAAKTSGGQGTLTITAGSVTTRGGVYLGSSSGGLGIFEVHGSDSAQIGIGSQGNIDGSWTQNVGSILRTRIDRTSQGVTPIFIDDAENDGSGGDVIFENGALLDVSFVESFINGGTFTVMEWEGSLTDHGLQFAPSVDTNVWSFNLNPVNKQLTVTAVGDPYVREFVHPGSRHKLSDLHRMRDMVAAGVEPWASTFADLEASNHTRTDYTPVNSANPPTTLSSTSTLRVEAMIAYHNSLMWNITGDQRYADVAVAILDSYSYLTNITGLTPLSIGQSCCHLVEAAEIIKHTYPGWSTTDMQRFSDMLVYPGYSNTTIPTGDATFYWKLRNGDPARAGNQGLFSMRSMLAMGVFLDNEIVYDRALRYMRGATNRVDDLPYPTGPPINGDPTATHDFAIQWGQSGRETTIADYGYNEVMANYIWENGQNEESSRDQAHGAVGLINIHVACEQAWNQGVDLYGHLDNRLLLGWEFLNRYNLSYLTSFPDQLTPWEPTIGSGEYLQRLVRTGRRFSLKVNPHIDGNTSAWTRGGPSSYPNHEIVMAHYRDRMGITGDAIKWSERGHDYFQATYGPEVLGPASTYSATNWGGLKYRRVTPGDPVDGFTNGNPNFAMNRLPGTLEAENYDYFPLDGQGRTYSDNSNTSSGLAYRPADGVDLSPASEGGFAVSSIEADEWLTYTVSVPFTDNYDISIRYASTAPGGTIQFSLDGTDVTGTVAIPHGAPASTGASDWQTLEIATGVPLTPGVQQLTLTFGGASDAFLLNSLTIATPPVFPVAHWKLDEGTGNLAVDCSGNGHHGTINGATWTTGNSGHALDFDGVSSQVTLPGSAFSSITDQVTISMWTYGDPAALPVKNSVFYGVDNNGGRVLNAHLPWSDSKIYWDAGDTGYDRISKTATEAEFEGSWTHWAFTKDATNGVMNIYRNGALWHTGTGKTKAMTGIASGTIGSQPSSDYYPGLIDDVRLYDVALAGHEINNLFLNPTVPGTHDHIWEGGESLAVAMSAATGMAGTEWDLHDLNCALVLDSSLTSGNPFLINLAAPLIAFDSKQSYSWLIVTTNGISGTFAADRFSVDSQAFAVNNPLGGGTFAVSMTGDDLFLDYTPAPYTDLENWRFTNFGTYDNTGNAADDFDADLDGVLNLVEYATGTNPNTPGGAPFVIRHATDGSGLEVAFDQIEDPNLNYMVEGTDDLSDGIWDPIWSGTGTSVGEVIVSDTFWPSGASGYFLRLNVSY